MHEQVSHRLPIPIPFYHDLESVIEASMFWQQDNVDIELRNSQVYGTGFFQTDAASKLQNSIQKYFRDVGVPVKVVVVTLDSQDLPSGPDRRQSNDHPNTFVVSAMADLTKKQGLLLILYTVESTLDFDPSLTNPKKIANDISTTIRHELVHDEQYLKVATRMGISKADAKQKFIDWGLIPGQDAPRTAYLGSHIELDAFGHEFAERMAAEMGVESALQYLTSFTSGSSIEPPPGANFGSNFEEFFSENPGSDFTAKLVKKIRKYLLRFKHHEIYESRRRKIMKITKKRLQKVINEALGREALNTGFGKEPHPAARFEEFMRVLEDDVLNDQFYDIYRANELYMIWRKGYLSWEEVVQLAIDESLSV